MQEIFAINKLLRRGICLCVMALFVGCAGTSQVVQAPVFYEQDCQSAIRSGTRALADFSREQVSAAKDVRIPDYAKARGDLARALVSLQPERQNPSKPVYEQAAVCFETALAAMDRIIVAQGKGDKNGADIGWEMMDQSIKSLLLVLDSQKESAGKVTVRR
ncbi:hypothetical protein [Geomobilimonas luticola]|uniref:Lipoprotein n=1 Tax=Geomobilimonas luticola TaxID=1114878 RepID=A0ABS5SCG0_9BACT|nr:hypothetical protein [Geomobilimonas luticola]MBT0653065.1 hypothetical protein [Geomobilimonas luticola]